MQASRFLLAAVSTAAVIPVFTPDVEINDPAFARACSETLLVHLAKHSV